MDWLTFTASFLKFLSDIVGSLAWPLFAAWFIVRFRLELIPLVRNITWLKLGSAEAKFGKEANEVLTKIAEAKRESPDVTVALTGVQMEARTGTLSATVTASSTVTATLSNSDEDIESFLRDLRSGPSRSADRLRNSVMVTTAFKALEDEGRRLVAESGNERFLFGPVSSALALSHYTGRPQLVSAMQGLQQLNDTVAHTPNFEPSDESTKTFLEGVQQLIAIIRKESDEIARARAGASATTAARDVPLTPNTED